MRTMDTAHRAPAPAAHLSNEAIMDHARDGHHARAFLPSPALASSESQCWSEWQRWEVPPIARDLAQESALALRCACEEALDDWLVRCETHSDGVLARIVVSWCGVRVHVDHVAHDARRAVIGAFGALACLLELPRALGEGAAAPGAERTTKGG